MTPQIALAVTDDEVARCHPVMHQLRPHVTAAEFVQRVRRMQQQGFQLAYLEDEGQVVAVTGFRILEQLVSGVVLYVDDLVTAQDARSRGHGASLLAWLRARAREAGCRYLELDSGVHRAGAHRFYFRHGLSIIGYHFRTEPLDTASVAAPTPTRP